jgi:autotransporter-associated beta strand protein
MKPRQFHLLALAGSTLLFPSLAPTVHAADLTWDVTDDGATITAGDGAWDLSAANWNGTPNVPWTQTSASDASNAAIFAGTDGTLLDPHVVTIGATTMAAESITFNSSFYQITGGTLALRPTTSTNGSITVAANKTATIDSAITYSSNAAANITVNTGGVLNLGGGATNSQYNFTGLGTVNMTAGAYSSNIGTVNVTNFNHSGGTYNISPGNNLGLSIGVADRDVNYTLSGTGILTLTNVATNSSATGTFIGIGTTTAGKNAKLTVQSGGELRIGLATTRAGELRIANGASSNGTLDVQDGTVTIGSGATTNQIYFFKTGADASRSATMTQSGGTVTTNGIQFGGTTGTYDAASSASLTLSGGSLYIGAQGITRGSAAGALPTTIQLQGGTLGADQNWSSSLDMALGTTGGGPIIRAQNSGGTNRNIGLSGNLSNDGAVNGTLTKTGGGDLTLSGTNSYSGGTTIQTGRLIIAADSALPTTGAVQVGNGGDDRLIFNAGGSPTFNQSITLASGAALVMRQAATLTNVTLPTAGTVVFNKDNASTVGFSLDSDVALTGDLTVDVGGGSTAPTQAVTLAGDFSGGFGLIKNQVGELVLSGTNTYTGNTTVSDGTLTLSDTSEMRFLVGASGVNNAISGSGTVNLEGMLVFDLTSAGTNIGDFWNIVDVGSLSEFYASSFGVSSTLGAFDETAGIWKISENGQTYEFSQATGLLTVIPEPSAALLGGLGLLALLRRRRLS